MLIANCLLGFIAFLMCVNLWDRYKFDVAKYNALRSLIIGQIEENAKLLCALNRTLKVDVIDDPQERRREREYWNDRLNSRQ